MVESMSADFTSEHLLLGRPDRPVVGNFTITSSTSGIQYNFPPLYMVKNALLVELMSRELADWL